MKGKIGIESCSLGVISTDARIQLYPFGEYRVRVVYEKLSMHHVTPCAARNVYVRMESNLL